MNDRFFHFLLRILAVTLLSIAAFDKGLDYWFPLHPEFGTGTWFTCLFFHLGIFLGGLGVWGIDAYLSRHFELQKRIIRPVTLHTLLFITSIVTPVTLLELALRNITTLITKDVSLCQKDPFLGWRLRPYAQSRTGAPVFINRHGLRGPDRDYPKKEGVTRILFLGDSIPYGLRLPYEDTFPYFVEQSLHSACGSPVECINAGVPGYSTWQEYLFFEREGYRYEPDVVVLSFCLNDVLHTYTGLRFGDYGVDNPVPYIEENFIDYLILRSAILHVGKSLYHRMVFGKTLKENAIYREGLDVSALFHKADYPEIQEAWNDTQAYIHKIADRCGKAKARFILVLFPYLVPKSETEIEVFSPKPIAAFAQQKGYASIDVWPLIELDMERQGIHRIRHYIQDACHPTAHGNRLVADALVQCLETLAAGTSENPTASPKRAGDS